MKKLVVVELPEFPKFEEAEKRLMSPFFKAVMAEGDLLLNVKVVYDMAEREVYGEGKYFGTEVFSTESFSVKKYGLKEAYEPAAEEVSLMYEDWITSGNP